MPRQGDLHDANYVLSRLGLFAQSGEGGPVAVSAGQVTEFATATGLLIAPYEVDAALLASSAFVAEYNRSNERSTDAPWDWPKTARDIEIMEKQTAKTVKAMFGE